MNRAEFIVEAASLLRTSSEQIEKIVRTAPYRYKFYRIPKRDGGSRDIHHPSPALKAIQRYLCTKILRGMPVHPSVYSYIKDRNIADNARQHVRANYVTRLDFSNFFPSITAPQIKQHIASQVKAGRVNIGDDLIDVVVKLLCRRDLDRAVLCLSIGAPSSPLISNSILYQLDCVAEQICKTHECTYTRYADDIYISGGEKIAQKAAVDGFLRACEIHASFLKINGKKTQNLSRKRRLTITGLILTSDRKISIGRSLKRSLKSKIFMYSNGALHQDEVAPLRGMLAHVKSVEPDFLVSLQKKYGAEVLGRIISGA